MLNPLATMRRTDDPAGGAESFGAAGSAGAEAARWQSAIEQASALAAPLPVPLAMPLVAPAPMGSPLSPTAAQTAAQTAAPTAPGTAPETATLPTALPIGMAAAPPAGTPSGRAMAWPPAPALAPAMARHPAQPIPEPGAAGLAEAPCGWPPAALRELPFECQLLNGPLAGARLVLRIAPAAGGTALPRLALQVSTACVAAWRARGVDLAAALAAGGPVVLEIDGGDPA